MKPTRYPKRKTPLTDAELTRWQLYVRKNTRINKATGCWDWLLCVRRDGYGDSSTPRHHGLDGLAHRLAYQLFVGPIPEGLLIRHQCHNKPCCNPAHLLIGTEQDNKDDDKRDRRQHSGATLTPDQVAEIKRLLALRIYSQYHIAALFAVTQPTISHIAIGKCWSYIPPATAPLASTNPTKGN